jgi:hypothetical protein
MELLANDGCSLFTQYCTEIVAVSLETITSATSQNRYNLVDSRVKKLGVLGKMVGPRWRDEISTWQG